MYTHAPTHQYELLHICTHMHIHMQCCSEGPCRGGCQQLLRAEVFVSPRVSPEQEIPSREPHCMVISCSSYQFRQILAFHCNRCSRWPKPCSVNDQSSQGLGPCRASSWNFEVGCETVLRNMAHRSAGARLAAGSTSVYICLALLGWQNAFINCWWFSVHSYCWTCGFRGPLSAQWAVGCPLATTHVKHFLRGFVGGLVRLGLFRRGLLLGVVWIC